MKTFLPVFAGHSFLDLWVKFWFRCPTQQDKRRGEEALLSHKMEMKYDVHPVHLQVNCRLCVEGSQLTRKCKHAWELHPCPQVLCTLGHQVYCMYINY